MGKDLTGLQFGELTVLEKTEQKQGSHALWRCRCSCGVVSLVNVSNLTGGQSKRCNDWKAAVLYHGEYARTNTQLGLLGG